MRVGLNHYLMALARPHPGPLPQERERGVCVLEHSITLATFNVLGSSSQTIWPKGSAPMQRIRRMLLPLHEPPGVRPSRAQKHPNCQSARTKNKPFEYRTLLRPRTDALRFNVARHAQSPRNSFLRERGGPLHTQSHPHHCAPAERCSALHSRGIPESLST